MKATSEGDCNDEIHAEISAKLVSIKPFWSCYYEHNPYLTIERFLEVPKAVNEWYKEHGISIDEIPPEEEKKDDQAHAGHDHGPKKTPSIWQGKISEEMENLVVPEGDVETIVVTKTESKLGELEPTFKKFWRKMQVFCGADPDALLRFTVRQDDPNTGDH